MGSLQSLRVDRGGGMVGILRALSSNPIAWRLELLDDRIDPD